MKTILQKRIEEAAEAIVEDYNHYQFLNDGTKDVYTQSAVLFMLNEIAQFILSNQWISVDEALPEKIKDKNYSEYVLARQEYYEHEHHVIARYDYGFNMWVSTMYFKPEFITHWMPIQSLEGGEK